MRNTLMFVVGIVNYLKQVVGPFMLSQPRIFCKRPVKVLIKLKKERIIFTLGLQGRGNANYLKNK